MPGVGSKIVANDYNTIQSAIAGVLGQNAAGYGQKIGSGPNTKSPLSSNSWNILSIKKRLP